MSPLWPLSPVVRLGIQNVGIAAEQASGGNTILLYDNQVLCYCFITVELNSFGVSFLFNIYILITEKNKALSRER
jgi:hypothetical protein